MVSPATVNTYEVEVPEPEVNLEVNEPLTVEELIEQYPWPVEKAKAIMLCESSGNPNAVGDKDTAYHSYGYFQVRALPGRLPPEKLLDPVVNVHQAYKLWAQTESFTRHWVNCSKRI